ncbi:MAG: nucleotide exchange factor GrpE [Gammaproteobacteria bacterium]|jgi:molecular chaperone GrpE|nr:nucleotide exchange factor GrpE [Gammaproteobacteria bacterium]
MNAEDQTTQGPVPEATMSAEAGVTAQTGAEAAPRAEDLRLLLEDARAKADENFDRFMRATAELENVRRRAERDLEAARKFALERFVAELLPVRDSLELGIGAAGEVQADPAKLHEGMQLTLKMLGDAMQKFGVERVDPQGQLFDPNLHQALSVQPRDDVPANTVVVVVQKGYTLNGRLVRPAMVMVSRAAEGGGVNEKA